MNKITIDGVTYTATPTTNPQPTDKTITLDGVTYILAEETVGAIEKIRINGKLYDLKDVEEVGDIKEKALQYNTLTVTPHLDTVDIYARNMNGDNWVQTIPAATTKKAGVMSAEDKKKLDSVEIINDLTTGGIDKALSAEMGKELSAELSELGEETKRIESVIGQPFVDKVYTKDDCEGMFWNGAEVRKSTDAYNGFVVIIQKNSMFSNEPIEGSAVSIKAFGSYPQIGMTDVLSEDIYSGYINNTGNVVYALITIQYSTNPKLNIKVTSGGLLGLTLTATFGNVNKGISIETIGSNATDGIRVTIPKGLIVVFPDKKTIQTNSDIAIEANNKYVYYLYVRDNGEFYVAGPPYRIIGEVGLLVASITPNAVIPVQGLVNYTYNGVSYGLSNIDEVSEIKESIKEIKSLSVTDVNAVSTLQGVTYDYNVTTPSNVRNAIKSVWLSCPTAGNIEKVLSGVNEVYIRTINNKPGGYSPAIYISSEDKDSLFQWYLKSQTEPRTGIETIQLTINSSFSSQFGLSGYSPLINIVIDWDVFGQNIREDATGIKIELSKIWRFRRDNVTIVESAKSAVANSVIGKTIVCFGDSLTEMTDTTNSLHYSDYISYMTGANVINCGVGGTQLRQRTTPSTTPSDNSQAYAALDIINMIRAACNKDFSMQIAANEYLITNASDDNSLAINNIKTIDWEKIDAVTIFAGTNDWYTPNTIGSSGSNDVNYTLGAINEIIRLVSSTYPHIKMFFFTPVVRWLDYSETNGEGTSAKWSDEYEVSGNGTLKQEAAAIMNEVILNHIPVCDMYNTLGWNKYNFKSYFQGTDGTHPRKLAGVMMIAKKMLSFIMSNNTL